jgi:hypothetical protein
MSKGHTVSVAACCAQTDDQSLPILGPHEEHHETTAASTGNLARKRAMSGCNRMKLINDGVGDTMGRFSLRVPGVLEDIGHPTNIAIHERSLHLVASAFSSRIA